MGVQVSMRQLDGELEDIFHVSGSAASQAGRALHASCQHCAGGSEGPGQIYGGGYREPQANIQSGAIGAFGDSENVIGLFFIVEVEAQAPFGLMGHGNGGADGGVDSRGGRGS